MNDLFGGFPYGTPQVETAVEFPPVNIWSNDEQLVLTAEIPGVNPDDLSINALEDHVSIEGTRKASEEKEADYHRQERNLGEFKRVFKMPFKIDPSKIEAKYEKGILQLILPRSEQDKPKQIKVMVG